MKFFFFFLNKIFFFDYSDDPGRGDRWAEIDGHLAVSSGAI